MELMICCLLLDAVSLGVSPPASTRQDSGATDSGLIIHCDAVTVDAPKAVGWNALGARDPSSRNLVLGRSGRVPAVWA